MNCPARSREKARVNDMQDRMSGKGCKLLPMFLAQLERSRLHTLTRPCRLLNVCGLKRMLTRTTCQVETSRVPNLCKSLQAMSLLLCNKTTPFGRRV
mmetsp:Transcript_1865/g.4307  ORF Transcript_1865/g.4307 Transcript_1865/m.4307 type:complete len:97 (+) Transcript_1865:285-575(+)